MLDEKIIDHIENNSALNQAWQTLCEAADDKTDFSHPTNLSQSAPIALIESALFQQQVLEKIDPSLVGNYRGSFVPYEINARAPDFIDPELHQPLLACGLHAFGRVPEKIALVMAQNRLPEIRHLFEFWLQKACPNLPQSDPLPITPSTKPNVGYKCGELDLGMEIGLFWDKDHAPVDRSKYNAHQYHNGTGMFVTLQDQPIGYIKHLGYPSMLALRTLRQGESFPLVVGSAYVLNKTIMQAIVGHLKNTYSSETVPVVPLESLGIEEALLVRPMKTLWTGEKPELLQQYLTWLEATRKKLESGAAVPRGKLLETLGENNQAQNYPTEENLALARVRNLDPKTRIS